MLFKATKRKAKKFTSIGLMSIFSIAVISCNDLSSINAVSAENQEKNNIRSMLKTLEVIIDTNIESKYTFDRLDTFIATESEFSAVNVAKDMGLPYVGDGIDYGSDLPKTIRPELFNYDVNKYSLIYIIKSGAFVENSNKQKEYKVHAIITSKTYKNISMHYEFKIKSVSEKEKDRIELLEAANTLINNVFKVEVGVPGYQMPTFTTKERHSRILTAFSKNNQIVSREKFREELISLYKPASEEEDYTKYLFNINEEVFDSIMGINKRLAFRVSDEGILGSGTDISHVYKVQFVVQKINFLGNVIYTYPLDFSNNEATFKLIVGQNHSESEEVSLLNGSLIKYFESQKNWSTGKEYSLGSNLISDDLDKKIMNDPWSNFENAPYVAQLKNGNIEDTLSTTFGVDILDQSIGKLSLLPGLKIAFTLGNASHVAPGQSFVTYTSYYKITSTKTNYSIVGRIVINSRDEDSVEIEAVVSDVNAILEAENEQPTFSSIDEADIIANLPDVNDWPDDLLWDAFATASGLDVDMFKTIDTTKFDIRAEKPKIDIGSSGIKIKIVFKIKKSGRTAPEQETIEFEFFSKDYTN